MVRKGNNELHAEIILKGRKEKVHNSLNAVAMVIRQLNNIYDGHGYNI